MGQISRQWGTTTHDVDGRIAHADKENSHIP